MTIINVFHSFFLRSSKSTTGNEINISSNISNLTDKISIYISQVGCSILICSLATVVRSALCYRF